MKTDALKQHRYWLKIKWDKTKPLAFFIGVNPSDATSLEVDKTTMRIRNYCVQNNYGGYVMLNAYSWIGKKIKKITLKDSRNVENIRILNKILDTCKSDLFIVCGRTHEAHNYISNKFGLKINAYKGRTFALVDDYGAKLVHPSIFNINGNRIKPAKINIGTFNKIIF